MLMPKKQKVTIRKYILWAAQDVIIITSLVLITMLITVGGGMLIGETINWIGEIIK